MYQDSSSKNTTVVDRNRRRWVTFLALPAIAAVLAVMLVGSQASSVSATGHDLIFETTAATTTVGGEVSVVVRIGEQATPAGAMAATLLYDEASIEYVGCETIEVFSACNGPEPGTIRIAAVSPTSWADGTEIVSLSFIGKAIDYDGTATLQVDEWLAESGSALTAEYTGIGPIIAASGDVNCDQTSNILDALLIAQYEVQTRTAVSGCPLPTEGLTLNTGAGDLNRDGAINIVDALLIAQCVVGNTHQYCA